MDYGNVSKIMVRKAESYAGLKDGRKEYKSIYTIR